MLGVVMVAFKDSTFYKKAKPMLDEFVKVHKDINKLERSNPIYSYIKNSHVFDQDGNPIDLDTKFKLLGHKRKSRKSKDLRNDLIKDIKEYIAQGGNLHISRKKLPFYNRLSAYTDNLKNEGKVLTLNQVMRDELGFREYSDAYFRIQRLEKINKFKDEDGYIDSYHEDDVFVSYVSTVAETYGVPYYFVVIMLADAKLKKYELPLDKVKFTEALLRNYISKHDSFVGMKRNDPQCFNALDYLTRYYSDGTSETFSKADWLYVFGLGDYDHRFRDMKQESIDLDKTMLKFKQLYGDKPIMVKDLNSFDYRQAVRKAVRLGVDVSEVFEMYGLKINGIKMPRFSRVTLKELPYYDEIIARKNELINKEKSTIKTKEDLAELKVKVMKQVYGEFKEKLNNYLPGKMEEEKEIYATKEI